MTVAELIVALSNFEPNTPVVVSGFDEGGYDDLASITEVFVAQTGSGGDHFGMYQDHTDKVWYQGKFVEAKDVNPPFKAIHLNF